MRLVYKSKVVGEVMAYQARPIVGFNEWSATPELRYGPAFRGGLQWGIVGNGRKPDPVTFMKEEGFNCKLRVLYWKKKIFPYQVLTKTCASSRGKTGGASVIRLY